LRGDAAVFERRQRIGDSIAHLRGRVSDGAHLPGDLGGDISGTSTTSSSRCSRISPVFGRSRADVRLRAVARLRRLLDGVFHRADDDLAIDRFLTRDRVGDLQSSSLFALTAIASAPFDIRVSVGPPQRRAPRRAAGRRASSCLISASVSTSGFADCSSGSQNSARPGYRTAARRRLSLTPSNSPRKRCAVERLVELDLPRAPPSLEILGAVSGRRCRERDLKWYSR
jgi:hypothetical protein